MNRGYISNNNSVVSMMQLINQISEKGVAVDNIAINKSFDDFISDVERGDTIYVISFVDIFASLQELFSNILELDKRGVMLRSINEPLINFSSDRMGMVSNLLKIGSELQAINTRRGLKTAKESGIKLGRPCDMDKIKAKIEQINTLRRESKLSVARACELTGFQPRTYYRYLSK